MVLFNVNLKDGTIVARYVASKERWSRQKRNAHRDLVSMFDGGAGAERGFLASSETMIFTQQQ